MFPRRRPLHAFIQLTRLDRPIGIYLLLWPVAWALWLAADGWPGWRHLLVFTLGTVVMRSLGCIINDWADRDLDGHVARTRQRPLVTGLASSRDALGYGLGLLLLALLLVLLTNRLTMLLAIGALLLAALYPFMKRHTHLPQLVLGAAFAWGVPMVFAAVQGRVPATAWLIYLTTLLWTVAYDTLYAMVDREDDLKIGIKSTAILFGSADRAMVALLQLLSLLGWALIGVNFDLGLCYALAVVVAALLFGHQQWLIRDRAPAACLAAFLHNQWVGAVLFVGIVLDQLLR